MSVIEGKDVITRGSKNFHRDTFLRRAQCFALCIYFISIHFESWDPFHLGIDYLVTKVTITWYIFLSFLNFRGLKSIFFYRKFTFPITIIFCIECFSGYFNQKSNYTEYFSLILFLNIVVFYLMLIQSSTDHNAVRRALNCYVIGGLVLSVFFILGIEVDSAFEEERVSLFGVNQNMLAVNLSVVLLIIVHRLFDRLPINQFLTIIYITFIPVLIYFMASTGSRSGFMSLFTGLVVFFTLRRTKNLKSRIYVLIFGACAVILMVNFFLENKVIGERLNNSIETGDLSGRDLYWEEMLDLTLINPFFGIGRTGFAFETDRIFGVYTSSHNAFLEILIMGGFVSLLFFMVFVYSLIKEAIKQFWKLNQLLSLMLMLPIIIMILVGHPLGTKISWGIFAFIIAYDEAGVDSNKKHRNLV